MKSIFPILLLSALIVSGCSKDNDDEVNMPENGIALRFNGTAVEFETYTAIYSVDQSWHNLNITGRDDTNRRLLSVLVRSQSEIVAGEYVYTNWLPNHTALVVLGDGADMGVGDYYNPLSRDQP